jgi:hypothetical protein
VVIKEKILSQLDVVSDKLSTQVRTTTLGVLALTWGLLVGDSPTAQAISLKLRPSLVVLGGAAVFVLFLDFLQYFAAYLNVSEIRAQMEEKGLQETEYDYRSATHRLRIFFFWAKMIALMLTVVGLLLVLGRWVLWS